VFRSARIKLTAWYLAIIMSISLAFSAFIYVSVTTELQNRFDIIERRLQLRSFGFIPPPGQVEIFFEDLEASRSRLFLILFYTNAAIFTFSAIAGYFLAGKTLSPIEKAMEEQKRFVADASHEFKTPLTSLQTSIEVALRDKKLSLGEAKEILKDSIGDIQNLTSLSNYLLGLARFQNNSLTKTSVNVKDIIKRVGKQITPIAKSKEVSLIVKSESISIKADEDSLEKLVRILLDNAFKYTPMKGRVWLTCEKVKRNLVIEIKDNGIGISKSDLPHIFERFYRADLSRSKEQIPGFGLGLSVAKEIVNMYKGSILVESKLGRGSTFIVKLPL
jgi:two-component system sensor histidine kinase CiaH